MDTKDENQTKKKKAKFNPMLVFGLPTIASTMGQYLTKEQYEAEMEEIMKDGK